MLSARIDVHFLQRIRHVLKCDVIHIRMQENKNKNNCGDVLIQPTNLRRTRMSLDPNSYTFEATRIEIKYLGQPRTRKKKYVRFTSSPVNEQAGDIPTVFISPLWRKSPGAFLSATHVNSQTD